MGLMNFLESRLGLPSLLRKSATEKCPPKGTSWFHTLGFSALLVLILMACTGLALAFHYVPSSDHAFDSIRILERDVSWGALVRSLHHYGASFLIVLLFVHVLRVYFHGAYKRPREFTWLFGLGLLFAVLGLSFTGYLLPWDQKAYFATKVGVNIAGRAPGAGESLRTLLYGGPELGPNTLSRFFILHVLVLPVGVLAFLGLHLWQIQRHGVSPVGRPVGDPGQPGKPYHPHHTLKEALVGLLVIGALFYVAKSFHAPLEAEANAGDRFYEPRPDWYFYAPFQLLKLFEGDLEMIGAFWLPNAFFGLLILLPFLDRNPARALAKRKFGVIAGLGTVAAIVTLTVFGWLDKPGHFRTPQHPLGASAEIRRGYDLVRREGCFQCHTLTADDGTVYGRMHEEEPPDLLDIEQEPSEIAEFLLDPDSDVMKPYPHLSEKDRLAIGKYLESLRKKD